MTIYIPARYLGTLQGKATKSIEKEQAKAKAKAAFIKLQARIQRNLIALPSYTAEHIFHPTRKWRLDYAWPDLKIGLEVHGGHHSNGRHVRGVGFAQDREKMNEAQLLGWIVLEVTTDNIPQLREWLERAIKIRKEQANREK
ncbi:hypothetical protein [Vibrio splendidus]|uniref:hypothetical protein n=1 Tax=Vibrio splendidus TaxID=29497 RepID=UPI00076A3E30|nr:hypothetical protein [Vibrio splendidus]PHX05489.1 hypothetical protein VSPL_28830 [Vibrio splendidus]